MCKGAAEHRISSTYFAPVDRISTFSRGKIMGLNWVGTSLGWDEKWGTRSNNRIGISDGVVRGTRSVCAINTKLVTGQFINVSIVIFHQVQLVSAVKGLNSTIMIDTISKPTADFSANSSHITFASPPGGRNNCRGVDRAWCWLFCWGNKLLFARSITTKEPL